jgi:LysM repeat protein
MRLTIMRLHANMPAAGAHALAYMRRLLAVLLLIALSACSRPVDLDPLPTDASAAAAPKSNNVPLVSVPFITPSPDPTRAPLESLTETYVVQSGETLGAISLEFNTTPEIIAKLNGIANVANIGVGQVLKVPVAGLDKVGPAMKIAPDSEVVYGPSTVGFDVEAFVSKTPGYLRGYSEEVEDKTLTGAQIVQLVAERYSVGPRVLLALIEYRGGWLSNRSPAAPALGYPAGHVDERWSGLYKQLMWAADHINSGYYGWKTRGVQTIRLSDLSRVRIAPGLNAGTIGLQSLLAIDAKPEDWLKDSGPSGFVKTYRDLFGDPFVRATEPLVPLLLIQPPLSLPWPKGQTWYFTGGAHGAWASGSAWGAIDFVPPGSGVGCYQSNEWVTSMSEGIVVRSREGEVLVALDADGHEQVGWAILYMHVEQRDRVVAGTKLRTGDRIGHPSCEGGYSTATHVHIARRYNGEWIAANGLPPFVMEGWTAIGAGSEYGGSIQKDSVRKEACECRDDNVNGISH